MFFVGRVSQRLFQKKDAKQYEDLLKCLQSSFPSQMYADLLEESAFQALLKR